MSLSYRLSSPQMNEGPPRAVVRTIEIIGVLCGIGAIVALSSNMILMILLGAGFIAAAAMSLVLSRPAMIVNIAIITMWFDSVGVGPVRTGRVLAALTVALLIARIVTSGWRPPKLQPRAWLGPAAFFMWALLSGLWSPQSGWWVTGIAELTLGAIYAIIMLAFLENEEQFTTSMRAWIWTGVPIAMISYYFYNAVADRQEELGEENRVVGFTGNANAYAALLALAVPVAFLLARRATHKWERLAYYGAIFGFMAALLTTGSRAGIIQLVVTLLYIAVTMPGLSPRQRVRSTMFGGVFVSVGMVIAAWFNPERYSVLGFFGDAGAGRVDLWNAATSSIGQRPVAGWSIGAFRNQMLDALSQASGGSLEITRPLLNRYAGGIEVHNAYLTIVLDLGVIGLVLFAVMILMVLKNLYDLRGTRWWPWAWVLIGGQFNLLVGQIFGSGYNHKFQWTIIGMSGVAYVYARSTVKADRLRSYAGEGGRISGTGGRFSGQPYDGDRTLAAKTDVRLRYPFRWVLLSVVLSGALIGGFGAKTFGTPHYSAYARVAILEIDSAEPGKALRVSDDRIQFVLNLTRSVPYLAEVQRQSGVDMTVDELAKAVHSTRPNFGAIVRITAMTADEELTRRIATVLLPSLDAVVEQARSGSIMVVDNADRMLSPQIDGDYSGPLYLTPFHDIVESSSTPRVVLCAFIVAGISGLSTLMGALLLHARRRVSTEEDVESLIGVPYVASVPRPILARERRVDRYYNTAADLIDASSAVEPRIVALSSVGLGGLQRRTSTWTALGLARVSKRPVVIVDLQPEGGLAGRMNRRRPGIFDVAGGTATIAQVTHTVRARLVPRSKVRLMRGAPSSVARVGLGGSGAEPASLSLAAPIVAELIEELSNDALVVVNLPQTPGPLAVGPVLALCDVVLVQLLDGWTPLDEVDLTVDAMSAGAPGRVGYMLISQ